MERNDCRDWFIMILLANVWVASTFYLFMHAGEATFATWSAVCTTMASAYHWFNIRDSKTEDAK